ncbi:MAG: hypothetical protein QOH59_2438 [Gemmatimonadales bacterium]|nr:hypothetical protein [Gemmatimonadales bacterium]
MGVKNGVWAAELLENGPEDSRIQAGVPGGRPNPNAGRLEASGQLGSYAGDDDLLDARAIECPGEQPHLPLTASPLATGGHVDDGRAHVLGRASAGQLPLSRTTAWGPLSRTTSASRVRSSAKLNGL